MKEVTFNFRNSGDVQNNDVVLEDHVFTINDQVHIFDLQPDNQTSFWRWGMALSESPSFSFDPAKGRYADRELRFIEIDAGALKNTEITLPSRLEVSTRYISKESVVFRENNYRPYSEVQVVIRKVGRQVEVSLYSDSQFLFIDAFELDNYRYFKVFAWADYHPFHVDMVASSMGHGKFDSLPIASLIRHDAAILAIPNSFRWLDASVQGEDLSTLMAELEALQPHHRYGLRSLSAGTFLLVFSDTPPVCGICLLQVQARHAARPEDLPYRFINLIKFSPYISPALLSKHVRLRKVPDGSSYQLTPLDPNRLLALLDICYQFPVFELTKDEQSYLEILYANLLNGTELDSVYSLPETWQKHAPDFDVAKIDPLLLVGQTNISLFGISAIHPESGLFNKFDEVIYAIQKHLASVRDLKKIEGNDLVASIPGLTREELFMIYKLMATFSKFNRGIGNNSDGSISIHLDDKPVYDTYRTYQGLNQFISEYFRNRSRYFVSYKERVLGSTKGVTGEDKLLKTDLRRQARHELAPVMGVQELASDMATLIRELPQEKGQMIGIFGKWGRGKTYFMAELWKALQPTMEPEYIRITYEAWKYKETPASWAYMYEVVAAAYLGSKKWLWHRLRYWLRIIWLNIRRKGIWPILLNLLALIGTIAIWNLTFKYAEKYKEIVIPFSGLGLIVLLRRLNKEYSTKAINLIKQYSIRHNYKSTLGIQAELQEELIKLLKTWIPDRKVTRKRLLLVVEDLDRCGQDKVMEIIDALRLLLDEEDICQRMTIITLVDDRIVKSAVASKLKEIQPAVKAGQDPGVLRKQMQDQLITEYLDKLFISAIKLGELSSVQKMEFTQELLRSVDIVDTPSTMQVATDSEEDPSFSAPTPEIARDPWPSTLAASNTEAVPDVSMVDRAVAAAKIGITRKERDTIIATMGSWENATPRNIYVLYYRYILAKNMLVNKQSSLQVAGGWLTGNGMSDLLIVIRYFTDKHDIESIARLSSELTKSVEPIYLLQEDGVKVEKTKDDWFVLLEILDLVIAY